MAAPANLTHLFAELATLDDLGIPLTKGSARLRYTCICVSQRYICLGSNTGGVYVFGRDSLKHLQIVFGDVEASPVTAVAMSPNDQNLALAVSSGQVVVMELNIERRMRPERIRQTADHLGTTVTAMVWDGTGTCLFVGDSQGRVTQVNIPSSKAKTIFTYPSQTIVRLETSVYQLDWCAGKLLVSTLTRSYLLNTSKQQFSQIGKKARDGEFGSCFFLEPSSHYPVIYCARPGSRMWEVDFDGNVLNTHQFKNLLATQPLPVITPGVDLDAALQTPCPGPQSVNFQKMFCIGEFILTWSNRGLYVFDPINVKVVLWTDGLAGIKDICLLKNEVYILFESQLVRRIVFFPLYKLCAALVTRQRCLLAARLLLFVEHFSLRPALMKRVKRELLGLLQEYLKAESHLELAERVQAMLEDVSEGSLDSVGSVEDLEDRTVYPQYMTQSSGGIVVVNDGSGSVFDFENFSRNRRTPPSAPFKMVEISTAKNGVPEAGASSGVHVSREPQDTRPSHEIQSTTEPQGTQEQPSSAQLCCDSSFVSIPLSEDDEEKRAEEDNVASLREDRLESEVGNGLIGDFTEENDVEPFSSTLPSAQLSGGQCRAERVNDDQLVEGADSSSNITATENVEDSEHVQDSQTVNSVKQTVNNEINGCVQSESVSAISSEIAKNVTLASNTTAENIASPVSAGERAQRRTSLPDANSIQALTPGESDAVRRINSMPHLVDESQPEVNTKSTVGQSREMQKKSSETARKDSSGSDVGLVVRATKKKKKKHVNIVDIPVAGSSSGELKRSLSTGTLKQKKKREMRHQRSLDSSPVRHEEDELYSRTDADADAISIATISSIEEEDTIEFDSIPVTPTAADDVFTSGNFNSLQMKELGTIAGRSVDVKKSQSVDEDRSGSSFTPTSSPKVFSLTLEQMQSSEMEIVDGDRADGCREVDCVGESEGEAATFSIGLPKSPDIHVKDAADTSSILSSSETVPVGTVSEDGRMEHTPPGLLLSETQLQQRNTPPETKLLHCLSADAVRIGAVADSGENVLLNKNLTLSENLSLSESDLTSCHERPRRKSADTTKEIIPPLLERLSAMGVSPTMCTVEEGSMYHQDLASMRDRLTDASRRSISTVKDRVTKFSSTTRSLIRRVKEKNPLVNVSRSPFGSPPSAMVSGPSSSHSPSQSEQHMGNTFCQTSDQSEPASDARQQEVSSTAVRIDLTSLLTKTEQTQKELSDPSVLLDKRKAKGGSPSKLRTVLDAWASELNQTLLALHQAVNDQNKKRKLEKMAQEKAGQTPEDAVNQKNPTENAEQSEKGSITQETDAQVLNSDLVDSGVVDMGSPVDPAPDFLASAVQEMSCGEDSQERKRSTSADSYLNRDLQSAETSSEVKTKERRAYSVVCNGQSVSDTSSVKPKSSTSGGDNVTSPGKVIDDVDIPVETDWEKVCHLQDPFNLTPQQHIAISTLAAHCLECGCFGNTRSFFRSVPSGPKTVSKTVQPSSSSADFADSGQDAEPSVQLQDGKVVRKLIPSPNSDSQDSQADSLKNSQKANSVNSSKKLSDSGGKSSSHSQLVPSGSVYSQQTSEEPETQGKGIAEADTNQNKSSGTTTESQEAVIKNAKGLVGDSGIDDVDNHDVDEEREMFLRLFYHFLPHWRIRRLLNEKEGEPVFKTWCALVTCCQALGQGDIVWMKVNSKDVTGALDYLRSGILPNKLAFLGHIASLFALSPLRVADFAAEVPRQITLRDLLHLCRLHGKPQQQVITRYLTQRLGTTHSVALRSDVVKQLASTTDGKVAILECLLPLLTTTPAPKAASSSMRHVTGADDSRLSPDVIKEVLNTVLSLVKEGETAQVLSVLWKHSYWPGCLKLLTQTNQWQQALQLKVQLDDISLLDGTTQYGFTPRNPAEWQYLLNIFKETASRRTFKQSDDPHSSDPASSLLEDSGLGAEQGEIDSTVRSSATCREQEETTLPKTEQHTEITGRSEPRSGDDKGSGRLTWMSLGLLAAHHLGARAAVKLLQQCCGGADPASDAFDHGGGSFSDDFYRTCIALSALEAQQRLVIHNMLEKVDSYLWAKKPVHLPPQVHYAVSFEKTAVQRDNTQDDHCQNLFARLSSAPVSKSQLAEDPDCHWGVNTKIVSVCAVCQVSATETVSHLEPGAYIFKCGHVFHKCCAPDRLCPLC